MENKYRKIGENSRISLYVDESLPGDSDGLVAFDKRNGKMTYATEDDEEYGKDIIEILSSLPDE